MIENELDRKFMRSKIFVQGDIFWKKISWFNYNLFITSSFNFYTFLCGLPTYLVGNSY